MNDVTDLAVISGGLSVPAWAGRDRKTLPAFLLLEQVLQPWRETCNRLGTPEKRESLDMLQTDEASSDSVISFRKTQHLLIAL